MTSQQQKVIKETIRNDPTFKAALLTSFARIIYENQNRPFDQRFDICMDIFLTIPIVMYSKRDYYLLEPVSWKIEDFKAAGLIDFWQKLDIKKKILSEDVLVRPKIISLGQLFGCFQVLFLGILVSFIVFAVEMVTECRKPFVCLHFLFKVEGLS